MPFVLLIVAALQRGAADTLVLNMNEAARRAVAQSPSVQQARAAILVPRGARSEWWGPFADNPLFEYGQTRRRSALLDTHDRDWSVTQEIDLVSWLQRRRAASAGVQAAEARVSDAARIVGLETRTAYVSLALAERRSSLTDSAARFAERLAVFARRQFDAGEANRLELNATILDAARARSAAQRAEAARVAAAADLGRLLGLPTDTIPRTQTLPTLPASGPWPDSVLQRIAREHRPDLLAAGAQQLSAERNLRAARLSVFPNLSLGVGGGREGGTDALSAAFVGVRIPLFHRQQAAVGQARSDRETALAELLATERAIRAQITSAASRFAQFRLAERRFASEVLRAAEENVSLTERALTEGEASVTEVLVLRNAAASAQLEYLDVLAAAAAAWIELAAAVGLEPDDLATLFMNGN